MDFSIPQELQDYIARLDAFIDEKIKPLQAQDDNERFFDHRREWARTDFEAGGLPRPEWEAGEDCAIRLSIGLEDPRDLIADLTQAFAAMDH